MAQYDHTPEDDTPVETSEHFEVRRLSLSRHINIGIPSVAERESRLNPGDRFDYERALAEINFRQDVDTWLSVTSSGLASYDVHRLLGICTEYLGRVLRAGADFLLDIKEPGSAAIEKFVERARELAADTLESKCRRTLRLRDLDSEESLGLFALDAETTIEEVRAEFEAILWESELSELTSDSDETDGPQAENSTAAPNPAAVGGEAGSGNGTNGSPGRAVYRWPVQVAGWHEVRLEMVSREIVAVTVAGGRTTHMRFADLGFADGRRNKAGEWVGAWETLLKLSEQQGTFKPDAWNDKSRKSRSGTVVNPDQERKLQSQARLLIAKADSKRMEDLNKRLQSIFGLADRPVIYNAKCGYTAKFTCGILPSYTSQVD